MVLPDRQSDRETADPGNRVSRAEFAAQFQAAFRLLWLVARGIVGDAALAEDVVQEAAIVALEKLDQFEAGTNFTAWMVQMVRFVALNESRKDRRRRTTSQGGTEPEWSVLVTAPEQTHPEARLGARGELPADQNYLDDRVVAALSGVEGVARACLLLRTIEGMAYADISRLLDIPEGTAMSHVHRARQYLRDRLGGSASAAVEAGGPTA